jgi:hypothetical protein
MSVKITGPNDPRVQAFLGKKFNRLTAIRFLGMKGSVQFWEFKCDCGGTKNTKISNVLKGWTGSCGCLHHEMLLRRNTVHGYAPRNIHRDAVYRCWLAIHSRCSNQNQKSWKHYGGRGISVCERWSSFENFLLDMGDRPVGCSIDRINNDGNYEPGNCRWATRKTQNDNKRTVHKITFNGKTLNKRDWAKEIGGNPDIIYIRLKRGWSAEKAVSTPAGQLGSNGSRVIPK